MEDRREFRIDTQDTCLLCLKDCKYLQNHVSRNNNSDVSAGNGLLGPSSSSSSSSAFKVLLRYLKLNPFQLCNFSSSLAPLAETLESVELAVVLCDECEGWTGRFAQLYRQFEDIRLEMDRVVLAGHGVMKTGEEDPRRLLEYQRRMRTNNPWTLMMVSVGENLRKALIQKCAGKIRNFVPRVTLKRQRQSPAGNDMRMKQMRVSKSVKLSSSSSAMPTPVATTVLNDVVVTPGQHLTSEPQHASSTSRHHQEDEEQIVSEDPASGPPALDPYSLLRLSYEEVEVEGGGGDPDPLETKIELNSMACNNSVEYDDIGEDPLALLTCETLDNLVPTGASVPPCNPNLSTSPMGPNLANSNHVVCTVCGLSFGSNRALQGHMNCHSTKYRKARRGGKPSPSGGFKYKCAQCGRGFERKDKLKRHMVVHTGERPFACSYCNQSSSLFDNHRKHLLTMHPMQVFAKYLPTGTSEEELQRSMQAILEETREEVAVVNTEEGEGSSSSSSKVKYACPHCEYKGKFPNDLKRHIMTRHFDKWVVQLQQVVVGGGGGSSGQTRTRLPLYDPLGIP